jgi:riboflavin biosynthesis pyrimidine reductase
MHEDENLFLVADDAGLAHREDVGGHGRDSEAEGDVPLEIVLDHQLRLHLELHELNDVLECV